jgi:cell division protein FtsN
MKKSAVIALVALTLLPFSGCSNDSEQTAYMQSPTAEQNAREAEQAEEEFALLAAKDEPAAKTEKKTVAKASKKTHDDKREPASAVETHKTWTVQLGAFKVKENAERLTAKIKGEGFPVLMVGKEGSKSGELYLVHLEPTPNKSEAQKWQTDLKLKSFDSTITMKRD